MFQPPKKILATAAEHENLKYTLIIRNNIPNENYDPFNKFITRKKSNKTYTSTPLDFLSNIYKHTLA